MKIKFKILIAFLLIATVPLLLNSIIFLYGSEEAFKRSIGRNFTVHAMEKAHAIDMIIEERVGEAMGLAGVKEVISAVREANRSYGGASIGEVRSTIDAIDVEWILKRSEAAAAKKVIAGDLSRFLKEYQGKDSTRYGEIFVTDAYGVAVAMTRTLTDYYQADEEWWEAGFAEGRGGDFIDYRGHDESVNALVMGIVVPVMDGAEAIGVLKINYKMRKIVDIVSGIRYGATDEVYILTAAGDTVIHSGGAARHGASEVEMALMEVNGPRWAEGGSGDDKTIKATAHVESDIRTRVPTPGARKGISGERWERSRWHLFMEMGQKEAFAPVSEFKETMLIVGLMTTSIVIVAALLVGRSIYQPIKLLHYGTELIKAGDLELKVGTNARDEVGDLSRGIDSMTEKLTASLAVVMETRDEMNIEIAERMKLEEALKRSNEALEGKVEERTKELVDANEQVVRSEKLAALGQFSSSVGHEIRNPLAIIAHSVYFLNMKLADKDVKVKKHLHILMRTVERVDRVVTDLLDFSRETPLAMKKADLNRLVEEAISHVEVPERVSVKTDLREEAATVEMDSDQMLHVIENLVANAVQAMPGGGELEVVSGATDGYVELAVRDTGEGIDEEGLGKIFEPLYSTKKDGTGLGLAIVDGIVKRHGGTVEVTSEAGKGTKFTVRLPLMHGEGAAGG